jgi:hypothetical protein
VGDHHDAGDGAGGLLIYGGQVVVDGTDIYSNTGYGALGAGVHIGNYMACASAAECTRTQASFVSFRHCRVFLNANLRFAATESDDTEHTGAGVSITQKNNWNGHNVILAVDVSFVRTHIFDNVCLGNTAPGGLFWDSAGVLDMAGCQVYGNVGTRGPGGGMIVQQGTVRMSDGTVFFDNRVIPTGFGWTAGGWTDWSLVRELVPRWHAAPVDAIYDYITRADYVRLYQTSIDAVTESVAQGGGLKDGDNVFVSSATVYYTLPVAPGYWLPNSDCTRERLEYADTLLCRCAVLALLPLLLILAVRPCGE